MLAMAGVLVSGVPVGFSLGDFYSLINSAFLSESKRLMCHIETAPSWTVSLLLENTTGG